MTGYTDAQIAAAARKLGPQPLPFEADPLKRCETIIRTVLSTLEDTTKPTVELGQVWTVPKHGERLTVVDVEHGYAYMVDERGGQHAWHPRVAWMLDPASPWRRVDEPDYDDPPLGLPS